LSQFGCQEGSQLSLPRANDLVAKDDPAVEEYFAEIPECETATSTREHEQGDDSLEYRVRFSAPALSSLNCLPQSGNESADILRCAVLPLKTAMEL
jgi:hypothetical protein